MKFSLEKIKTALAAKRYLFFDNQKAFQLNIIAIRSNNPFANRFDDWLYLIYRNEQLEWQVQEYMITTDPGSYWLKSPMNVNGTAILVPDQYIDSHKIGLHRGQYEALVQRAPVKVWRDNNRDTRLDTHGAVFKGLFGINIHRSNANGESQVVEKWSAGCTVFRRVADFNAFMNLCRKAAAEHGNSFSYTLLEEKDLIG